MNDYVGVMRQQGAGVNAKGAGNTETDLLNRELIEYYKQNKTKAQQVIDSVEKGDGSTQSPQHYTHYTCAVIALRGYPNKVPTNSVQIDSAVTNREQELTKLARNGWRPVNEQAAPQLLFD